VKTKHSVSVVVALFSLSSISCTTRVRIDDVVRGFFGEVNRSNFENAITKYLAASLINDFNTPAALGRSHRTIQESFQQVAGSIDSVDVTG
jgi:hypothetical protein